MNLLNCIKSQMYLMIKKSGFWFSALILIGVVCFSYINSVIYYDGYDITRVFSAGSMMILNYDNPVLKYQNYFMFILPFIVSIPFSFSYFEEHQDGLECFVYAHCPKVKYLVAKNLVCFIAGFLVMFISCILSLLLCTITFSENGNTPWGVLFDASFVSNFGESNYSIFFIKLYVNHPIVYILIYSVFFSAFCGICSAFSCSCSFWIRKFKILLFLPVYLLFYICNSVNNLRIGFNCNIYDYILITSITRRNNYFMPIIMILMVVGISISILIKSNREEL